MKQLEQQEKAKVIQAAENDNVILKLRPLQGAPKRNKLCLKKKRKY